MVVAIIGILASLLLPVLARGRGTAYRVTCASNLHQLGLATQLYWDDHSGDCFRYLLGATNAGQNYWFGWLGDGVEGQRPFDPTQGALFPYLRGRGVEICPSLSYCLGQFKLKASGAAYGYGYNINLSAPLSRPPVKAAKVGRTADVALMADAAQVNDFQAPASQSNPMLEEFYYLSSTTNYSSRSYYPNGHFRHARRANVAFCDGHIGPEKMVPGSLDPRLPAQSVGSLREEILAVR